MATKIEELRALVAQEEALTAASALLPEEEECAAYEARLVAARDKRRADAKVRRASDGAERKRKAMPAAKAGRYALDVFDIADCDGMADLTDEEIAALPGRGVLVIRSASTATINDHGGKLEDGAAQSAANIETAMACIVDPAVDGTSGAAAGDGAKVRAFLELWGGVAFAIANRALVLGGLQAKARKRPNR